MEEEEEEEEGVVEVAAVAASLMLILQCVLIEVITRVAGEMAGVEQEEEKKTENTKRPRKFAARLLIEFPPVFRAIFSAPASV